MDRKKRNLLRSVLLCAALAAGLPTASFPAEAGSDPDAAVQAEEGSQETRFGSDVMTEEEEAFSQWNEDAPALNALIDYVEDVTDENSEDYIPQEERIAAFDMDGTLMGELYPTYLEYYMLAWRILKDPSIEPDAEMLKVGRLLRDCAPDNSFPEDMAMQHAVQAARAYAGMTLNEFSDFVTSILLRDVDGFEGMTYGESFYLPMVEVVEYLQENGFKCYVCSGSDRFICRTFLEGMLDIPYENIIGMDVELEATGQGNTAGLDYVFTDADNVLRTDRLLIKNLKTNKVLQIAQEIGRQPVLSFGNSSGDVSMHNYTLYNNPYKSAAFMLVADDDVRDYGNPEKGAELKEKWSGMGFGVISMAEDWKTIYGENVKKTGTFHWMEELADERTADETLDARYLGVKDYGLPETNKDNKDQFLYRFDVNGKEAEYSIDNGTKNEDGNYDYPVQNVLKEGYCYTITLRDGVVTKAVEKKEYTPPVRGKAGERTLANFLKNALMPVGKTLYIYGGGWDWQDVGSSVQARTIGVSEDWVRFFESQDENYTYKAEDGDDDKADPEHSYYPYGEYNEYYYAGLDCSGFVGWTLYNTLESVSGNDGYVMGATGMAKMLSERGYGEWTQDVKEPDGQNGYEMKPGDVMSINGHVWIALGTCSDGSVVIVHATPSKSRTGQPGGGVQISAVGRDESCEAYALADRYMSEYFPEWYERYPVYLCDPDTYFTFEGESAGRFTWDVTGSAEGLSDPEALQEKTPDGVLKLLFGET